MRTIWPEEIGAWHEDPLSEIGFLQSRSGRQNTANEELGRGAPQARVDDGDVEREEKQKPVRSLTTLPSGDRAVHDFSFGFPDRR